jgi:hypothetical protein
MKMTMKIPSLLTAGLALATLSNSASLRADMVTDWNANTEQALLTAAEGPPVRARFGNTRPSTVSTMSPSANGATW